MSVLRRAVSLLRGSLVLFFLVPAFLLLTLALLAATRVQRTRAFALLYAAALGWVQGVQAPTMSADEQAAGASAAANALDRLVDWGHA